MFFKFVITGFIIGIVAAALFGTDIWVGGAGCAMIAGAIYIKYC